jgi:hypothetical protein
MLSYKMLVPNIDQTDPHNMRETGFRGPYRPTCLRISHLVIHFALSGNADETQDHIIAILTNHANTKFPFCVSYYRRRA